SDRLDETDERRQHADEVLRSAERAASLTRQLLVFSGKHVTRNSSIDLSRMLIDMRAAITQIAGDRVGIEYELADDLWPVRCDTAQLHQLVLSLAVNAQEAMPDGGRLEFQTANTTIVEDPGTDPVPPGSYVLLRISDTGRGMSRDTLAHLFEPFFTTKEQGTGLGLATVYGIVQQSEGHVRVRSRPGHGSSFYIYLPHASAAAGSAAGPRATTGAALLIVEDDDAVRELTTRVLRRSGHEVITARNGYEALAVLRSGAAVRLVIADIVMPGMNGVELGEHVRRDFPNLPILFVSGYVAPAGLAEGSLFMEKPYRPEQLVTRVNELLG
ncbi:MAG: ATP-binding protein, partial [Longimicrobiales bacterium]